MDEESKCCTIYGIVVVPMLYSTLIHMNVEALINKRAFLITSLVGSHTRHNLWCVPPFLSHAHLGCKGGMCPPFARVPGGCLLQHPIDLFQRETFGFGNEEVGVYEASGAKGPPEEEHFGSKIALIAADEVGSDDCDDLMIPPMSARELRKNRRVWTYAIP